MDFMKKNMALTNWWLWGKISTAQRFGHGRLGTRTVAVAGGIRRHSPDGLLGDDFVWSCKKRIGTFDLAVFVGWKFMNGIIYEIWYFSWYFFLFTIGEFPPEVWRICSDSGDRGCKLLCNGRSMMFCHSPKTLELVKGWYWGYFPLVYWHAAHSDFVSRQYVASFGSMFNVSSCWFPLLPLKNFLTPGQFPKWNAVPKWQYLGEVTA